LVVFSCNISISNRSPSFETICINDGAAKPTQ